MTSWIKYVLITVALGCVTLGAGTSANAEQHPYWRSHWGWYDNTYRPYYNNYYYSSPGYSGYYAPSYGGYYAAPAPYYGGYNSFYGPTYVAPGIGVRTGRVTYGWW